jgi:hypothetical protein
MKGPPRTIDNPPSLPKSSLVEPKYDPNIHLDKGILNSAWNDHYVVYIDDYDTKVKVPETTSTIPGVRSRMAYSSAFKVLSDEGIRIVRKIIDDGLPRSKSFGVGNRTPSSLRGLGYTSQFIKDFNECPILTNFLSKFAGLKLIPHTYMTSYSHCNIGAVGNNVPVDQWHADSVPFVLVILMSDLGPSAKGGELQVLKMSREESFKTLAETDGNPPSDKLVNVVYPGVGYALFMQGSHMVHHVTPVQNGACSRITVVNSYMPLDATVPDDTRLAVFKNEPETCYYEFARHRAWRASNQLQQFLENRKWTSDPVILSKELKKIIEELDEGVDILLGKSDSHLKNDIPYYKEKSRL